MPGFVDVSNMSDLEVKRLGQRDDDFGIVDQPRRGRRAYARPASNRYSADTVWAAACAAQRVNGGYIKECVFEYTDGQPPRLIRDKNRHIMAHFLANPDQLLAEDLAEGQRVRSFLHQDLTFRAVKGKLTEFDSAVSRCLAVDTEFDSYAHKYELAVVASLPASAERTEKRQDADSRVAFARGGLIGAVGDKVLAQVEVLSAVYSQNYNCWFIKGITDKDQPVFFSYKQKHDAGTWLSIQGTVKAHRDNLTQLNRVKVI